MTKYEKQKRLINKNFFKFDLTDDLISLAYMVALGEKILEENNCKELLIPIRKKL